MSHGAFATGRRRVGARERSGPAAVRVFITLLRYVWAGPYSLVGLGLGCVGLLTGGRARVRGSVLEFHGGFVRWFVAHLPTGAATLALTLGHVILGQTPSALDAAHAHELVHVRQFERWGPFMGVAYLGTSLILWLVRRDPYRDNPFEREAYRIDERA